MKLFDGALSSRRLADTHHGLDASSHNNSLRFHYSSLHRKLLRSRECTKVPQTAKEQHNPANLRKYNW
jgi:hypothetical protein